MAASYSDEPVNLRPRARLVSLLGEQLIRDGAVGILELVKNGYDADAGLVTVRMAELGDPELTTITVSDDGCGMSPTQVREHWLSPATGNKALTKALARRTPLGRQLLGEKGVGRFAVQRLGYAVELTTRAQDEPEVRVFIDWGDFEHEGAYLDEIEVEFEVVKRCRIFGPGETGTRIQMFGARTPWTGVEMRRLQRMLRRLQNPVGHGSDFRVELICPEYKGCEDIDPTGILEKAHYSFEGRVGAIGQLEWSYACTLPGASGRTSTGVDRLVDLSGEVASDRPTRCGPFGVRLHVWDRSRDMMKAAEMTERELDSHCGISIYRDEFRVLPYGEHGDDWLGLDARRINVPSRRVGNRNIVGIVELTHDDNPELRDKTSREGLITNGAFEDLRALVRAAITVFEVERLQDRTAANTIRATQSSKTGFAARLIRKSSTQDASDVDAATSQDTLDARLIRGSVAEELAMRAAEDHMEELHALAATGLRVDRLGHQLSGHAQRASDALTALRRSLGPESERALEALDSLETTVSLMRNAMRDLVPDGAIRQSERRQRFDIQSAIDEALRLNADTLTQVRVSSSARGPLEVFTRRSNVVQILDNLIGNAAYWSSAVEGPNEVFIDIDPEHHRVIVGDSGPGVSAQDRERIFTPYFSRRPDSYGLGLHISLELARGIGGGLFLMDPAEQGADHPGGGASFCLLLPRTRGGRR